MYPVLIAPGGFEIHSYGVTLALGIVFGLVMAVRQAERDGLNPERVTNVLLLIVALGLIGARGVYVLVNWSHFAANPAEIVQFHRGGQVYYGSLIGGMIAAIAGTAIAGIPLLRFLDITPPGLALGQLLGRLGCLLNGCCYGSPTDLPWAIRLTHGPGAIAARHPTQIYEMVLMAVIMAATYFYQRRLHRPGMVLVLYFYSYGTGRFIIELFRGDSRGGSYLLGLSISQCISVAVLASGLALHGWIARTPQVTERQT